MSAIFDLIYTSQSSSTHHKLALKALNHLRGKDAPVWRNLFLSQFKKYLQGAKAPDDEFKDFRNHVLHVSDGYWGGAVSAAEDWFQSTVRSLRKGDFPAAIYFAGVMSHYISDPVMPLHTGQSESEGPVHRPLEWSVTTSCDDLFELLENELGGYPEIELEGSTDWLARIVRRGADTAHPHYRPLIDHYNLAAGVKNPPAGLDAECRRRIAPLLGFATISIARVLDRAFEQADVVPPEVSLAWPAVFAQMTKPIQWVFKRIKDAKTRSEVERMYREFQETGKVIDTLPADDRAVRKLHAKEVLKVSLKTLDAEPIQLIGTKHGSLEAAQSPQPASILAPPPKPVAPPAAPISMPKLAAVEPAVERPLPAIAPHSERPVPPPRPAPSPAPVPQARFYLTTEMPVVDAPSIGPKTADRLEKIGVSTVANLLALRPEDAAARLKVSHITAAVLREWQKQANLMCRVPELRGHDVQILVGCGIEEPRQLAEADADSLLDRVSEFVATTEGERILRSGSPPDRAEVVEWIGAARSLSARAA